MCVVWTVTAGPLTPVGTICTMDQSLGCGGTNIMPFDCALWCTSDGVQCAIFWAGVGVQITQVVTGLFDLNDDTTELVSTMEEAESEAAETMTIAAETLATLKQLYQAAVSASERRGSLLGCTESRDGCIFHRLRPFIHRTGYRAHMAAVQRVLSRSQAFSRANAQLGILPFMKPFH